MTRTKTEEETEEENEHEQINQEKTVSYVRDLALMFKKAKYEPSYPNKNIRLTIVNDYLASGDLYHAKSILQDIIRRMDNIKEFERQMRLLDSQTTTTSYHTIPQIE